MTLPTIEAVATVRSDGGEGKTAKFKGVAYSGGVLRVAGYPRGCVIDLRALSTTAPIPIVVDHENRLDHRVGHATVTSEGGRLLVAGEIVGGTPLADRAIALLRSAGGLSLSVGVQAVRAKNVEANKEIEANGRRFRGPVELVSESSLREISVVGVGADAEARAIAAQKERTPVEPTTTETPPTAPAVLATLGPAEAERARIREIVATFRDLGADSERDRLIEAGASTAEANAVALRIIRANRANIPGGPVMLQARAAEDAKTIAAGAARFLGASEAAIKAAKLPVDCEAPTSLLDLAERCVRAERGEVPSGRDKVIQAAFSTNSFASTLSTALSVVALDRWQASPEPALRLVRRVPVNDFKPTTLARLDGRFGLQEVGDGGELKHGQVGGPVTTVELRTHGRIVMLTRKDLINDNAQMLAGVPAELGAEAARSVGDEFATRLVDTAFFHVDNANVMTGGSSALSITSLGVAVQKLRDMKSADGRALNLPPAYLLVGSGLETTARAILNSAEVGRDDGGPTGNPVRGVAELLVDARLPTGQWWLFAPIANAAFVMGTLRGVETPVVEPVEPPADRLGAGWRAYFDFAVAGHEPRAAVRSLGA